ncbi:MULTISPECIES: agmatinase family protein [Hymenobacter]|uniref:Agmatinase family protein n=1 Tax=Hymenobacter jejuensis TaxID=2502781 RepID=A0A5B8A4T2_9BACT|nr:MULTISPECIES: agmatinase family protein [Hymenobacter]MBC6990311.1 agmatinase family protein [Hymenobacter sp. BT491]QDA62320.1 agmatinase family protein [Hymenobacter jejuensis]
MTSSSESSLEQKLANFDPNALGDASGGVYGLPFTVDEAQVVVVPVPWEVTVSYGAGTAKGPAAIRDASFQVDLYDPDIPDAWRLGLAMEDDDETWAHASNELRPQAANYIGWLEDGMPATKGATLGAVPAQVTAKGKELLEWLKQKTGAYLDAGKGVVVLGGDHSTPLGYLHALAERHEEFGILQIDAHCDLRPAYEGFEYSHASIMYNALQLPQVKKLVQVGIRDLCQQEAEFVDESKGRVVMFQSRFLRDSMYAGKSWKKQCNKIIAQLPPKVYLSFDIDGLDPKLCPGTGTPVPGGLEFEEALYLIRKVVRSGREIIGCDLNEVAPGDTDWNGVVGARLLYHLCNWMAVSQGRIAARDIDIAEKEE